jgi:hypothetical protein
MSFITEAFLLQKAKDTILENAALKTAQRTGSLSGVKKVFLAHSHNDKELARGLKNFLYSVGIDLYIDWLDASMPPNANKETAEKIKKRIGGSDHVIVLATNHAVRSRWVPWEIGIADIAKTPSGVSIIPVVDSTGSFDGNEYLQLYRQICIADGGSVAVFYPGETKGYHIDFWLKKGMF